VTREATPIASRAVPLTKLVSFGSPSAVSKMRRRGPTKGTAGAGAVSAASALVLIGRLKGMWDNSKTALYSPMMATHNATTSGMT
jgi:hypothetical protein